MPALAALVAAALVAGSLWSWPAAGALAAPTYQAPAAPSLDGFESRATDSYVVYASSQSKLDAVQPSLDYAVEQWRRHFGEAPPRIAVVIFDSQEQARSTSLDPLRRQGLAVLPWLAPELLRIEPFPNLGIVARQAAAEGGLEVMTLLEGVDRPDGFAVQQGDVLASLNGLPIESIRDFRERLEAISTGSEIELRVRRGDQELTLRFAKPPDRYFIGGEGGLTSESVLSHEVGHLFLVAYARERLERPPSDQQGPSYGHPAVPDWFDEGIALLHEPAAMQEQRVATLRHELEQGAELIPLGELFQMTHPRAPSQVDGGARPDEIVPGVGVSVGSGDTLTPSGQLTDEFAIYYQTSALLQLLRAREGDRFIERIANGLIRGESMATILQDARSVPADLDELRRELRAWVTS